jgi:hypothetical protein
VSDKFYFSHPNVSNSNLKELRRYYHGDESDLAERLREQFIIGSLVDNYVTPTRPQTRAEIELGATVEQGQLARGLGDYMLADPLIRVFVTEMVGQFAFFKSISFEFDGETYTIRGKCKFDLFSRRFKIGVEIKTTSCKTYKAFVASIEFLDYDQAAAWYMDLAKIDRLWIIAICKSTKQIFKFVVQRGDETHARGVAKYSRWGYNWITIVDGFIHQSPINETDQISTSDEFPPGERAQSGDGESRAFQLPFFQGLEGSF